MANDSGTTQRTFPVPGSLPHRHVRSPCLPNLRERLEMGPPALLGPKRRDLARPIRFWFFNFNSTPSLGLVLCRRPASVAHSPYLRVRGAD